MDSLTLAQVGRSPNDIFVVSYGHFSHYLKRQHSLRIVGSGVRLPGSKSLLSHLLQWTLDKLH